MVMLKGVREVVFVNGEEMNVDEGTAGVVPPGQILCGFV